MIINWIINKIKGNKVAEVADRDISDYIILLRRWRKEMQVRAGLHNLVDVINICDYIMRSINSIRPYTLSEATITLFKHPDCNKNPWIHFDEEISEIIKYLELGVE